MASLYFPNSQESEFKVQPVLAANINRPQFRVQQALVVHSQMILARPIVVAQYLLLIYYRITAAVKEHLPRL